MEYHAKEAKKKALWTLQNNHCDFQSHQRGYRIVYHICYHSCKKGEDRMFIFACVSQHLFGTRVPVCSSTHRGYHWGHYLCSGAVRGGQFLLYGFSFSNLLNFVNCQGTICSNQSQEVTTWYSTTELKKGPISSS